jgi:SAM-dependent methyltransferase
MHRNDRITAESNMKTTAARSIEACLLDLFRHLGIERAHIAAGGPPPLKDWHSLATLHPERVASLTLISPPVLDPAPVAGLASRMLVFAGDKGRLARGAVELTANLSSVSAHILRGYEWLPWSDVIADWSAEIGSAMLEFLDRHPLPAVRLSEPEGEVAGVTYRIRGAGPPLVLLPLSLAPSQWDPLIATLSARYCTISLGGPLLGVVGILEERGRSNYLAMVKSLLDLVDIRPNEVVLEVGGGSGVVIREVARRTAGANRIIDVDISPYLLREAEALAKRAGLANRISFQEGHAEAIPLTDGSVDVALSFTVMEEGDADRMLSELVRVTRPGGRIAAIVRSLDMPWWTNAALSPTVRAKVDAPGRGDVAPAGCADASLYERFRRVGLVGLKCFSQLASVDASQVSRLTVLKQLILASLTEEERAAWGSAVSQAEANGTFFIATPHHCALGIKPSVAVL